MPGAEPQNWPTEVTGWLQFRLGLHTKHSSAHISHHHRRLQKGLSQHVCFCEVVTACTGTAQSLAQTLKTKTSMAAESSERIDRTTYGPYFWFPLALQSHCWSFQHLAQIISTLLLPLSACKSLPEHSSHRTEDNPTARAGLLHSKTFFNAVQGCFLVQSPGYNASILHQCTLPWGV